MQHQRHKLYAGDLTPENAAEGMRISCEQAARLAHDAKLLLDSGSYPTAAALATLSIEEASKSIALRGVLAADGPADLRRAWAGYRSHRSKSILWRLLSAGLIKMTVEGSICIDFSGAVQRHTDINSEMLNDIKQAGLYTDCVGEKPIWAEPRSTITIKTAENLVKAAQAIAAAFGRAPTAAENQLWAKHLAPIGKPGCSEAEMAQGVERYISGLIEGGFLPATMRQGLVVN